MQSYNEIADFIGEKIAQLSLTEQVNFLQNLIGEFVKNLPDTWLDNELDSEKPHYQAIFSQINEQTWQADTIERQLSALDTIMWQMGDHYPHSTSDEILLVIELLDYWLILLEFKQKSVESNTIVTSAVMGYLSYFDELVEIETGETADFDTWLDYPQTKQVFDTLQAILANII